MQHEHKIIGGAYMNELQIIKLENTDISRWDFSMLKAKLQSRLEYYSSLVYTDANIKDAKGDRADLNKVKKAIEDARKAFKAKCLEPYEALEPKIKELVEMVEQQRVTIDTTVKDYEQRKKDEKERAVREYYDRKAVVLGALAEPLYPKLFDKKWCNASTARPAYEQGILEAINSAAVHIDVIRSLASPFVDTLLDVYVDTLSLEKVMAKKDELEQAAQRASISFTPMPETASPPSVPEEKEQSDDSICMKIFATGNQLEQLTDFMKAIGVRYEML